MPTSVRGMKTIEKSFVSVTAPGSASKKDGHPALSFQNQGCMFRSGGTNSNFTEYKHSPAHRFQGRTIDASYHFCTSSKWNNV